MRQNLGHTKTSIGSTLGQKASKLSGSPGSQFVGFDADRNSYLTYCWSSPSSSQGSSPSSSMLGDGAMIRRKYRLASHIQFEDQNTKEYKNKPKQPRHTQATGSSYSRLFSPPTPRPAKPKQLTLFDKPDEHKSRCKKPLPVSPLTGHILGAGGYMMESVPGRKAKNVPGTQHKQLW
eukprot:TRINITY_DN19676_c0_g1_i1.p1 TRINITY_DN19676_c0_g1~~TRINITY_DN19676_c0_g1_i1.p1  ORF type:complete len:177 (-),score=38.94 TRINITY_DN19676_c0_g1_i1:55-585(-)